MNDNTCDVVVGASDKAALMAHLFPGDGDEHGAILHAGVVNVGNRMKLLVREVFPARLGSDYVAGQYGYRALHPSFIHKHIISCRDQGLAYLAVHNHNCDDRVAFSGVDIASHNRGYPALLDIGKGVPVGALVLGRRSMQADIWTNDGRRRALGEARVVGSKLEWLYPTPQKTPASPTYENHDRQIRMFGHSGQIRLARSSVAVIGLGGIGSLVCEYLARLGVGEILAIDPDQLEISNLSRVVGATRDDALAQLTKVEVACRHAAEASNTAVAPMVADVAIESVALKLRGCDYIFLAADSMRARLVFNALVHQYLIPGVQLGAKVRAGPDGQLLDVMSAIRPVRPGEGCLWCNQLIDPHQLALEAKSDEERRAQAYGVEEPNPSVITLNAVAAAHAVNDFLFYVLGISQTVKPLTYRHHHFLDDTAKHVIPRKDETCRECGRDGRYGRGDTVSLPCTEG
jgi:hypothetical protein